MKTQLDLDVDMVATLRTILMKSLRDPTKKVKGIVVAKAAKLIVESGLILEQRRKLGER